MSVLLSAMSLVAPKAASIGVRTLFCLRIEFTFG